MESFKITESYGAHCNECGRVLPAKASISMTINNVQYTLCEDCFKLFIGQLYNTKPEIFDELITVLGKKDRNKILALINK